jgi:hypothetical protein
MDLNLRRRVPALLAAAALAGGVAAATTGSAYAATESRTAVKCAKAAGKYKPQAVKRFTVVGHNSEGKPMAVGGYVTVYRSAACKTAWVTTVKRAKFTKTKLETGATLEYVDPKTHKTKLVYTYKSTKGSLSTKAAHLGRTTKVTVSGGFVADYQYEGGGKVVVRF